MATLEEFINELIGKELLTSDEKDIILGNDAKGIEAKYAVTIGKRTITFNKPQDIIIKEKEDLELVFDVYNIYEDLLGSGITITLILTELKGFDFIDEKEAVENINLAIYEESTLELFAPKENLTLKELDVRLYNVLAMYFPEEGLPTLAEDDFEQLESLAIQEGVITANEENSPDKIFVLLFDLILEMYTGQEQNFETYSGIKEIYCRLILPEGGSVENTFNYYFPNFKLEIGYDEYHLENFSFLTLFFGYTDEGIILLTLAPNSSLAEAAQEEGIPVVYEGLNIFKITSGGKTGMKEIAVEPEESSEELEELGIIGSIRPEELGIEYVGNYVKYDSDQDGDLDDEILYRIFKSEPIYNDDYAFLYEYIDKESNITKIISEDVLRPGEIRLGVNDNIYDDEDFDMSQVDILEEDGVITRYEMAYYSYRNLIDTLVKHCRELPEAQMVEGITSDVRTLCSKEKHHGITINLSTSEADTLEKRGLLDTPSGQDYWYAYQYTPLTLLGQTYNVRYNKGSIGLCSYSYSYKLDGTKTKTTYKVASSVPALGIRPVIELEPGVLRYSLENGTGDGSRENPIILQKVPEEN